MEIIIKHRRNEGRIQHNVRIPRYWRNKETGSAVEVRKFLNVDGQRLQVIYFDEFVGPHGHELSSPYSKFQELFEPIGNFGRM